MRSGVAYQDILAFCSRAFAGIRVTRLRNFAVVIYSLIANREATLAAAARSRVTTSYASSRQQLYRFFVGETITLAEIGGYLVPLVFHRLRPDRRIPLILDTTTLVGGIQCLVASVPLTGRSIPVAAVLYRHDGIPDSQNRIEERFVRFLVEHIPARYRVAIIADRGFGRASFFQVLRQLKLPFVIRVKTRVWIEQKGKKTLLSRRWIKNEGSKLLEAVGYRGDGSVTVNICISKAAGVKELWYLATTLRSADQARGAYERRFQTEETFRDLKHQLGLERIRLTRCERVEKMVAALLVAITILLWIGKRAEAYRHLVDEPGSRARLSATSLALALLTHPPPQFGEQVPKLLRQLGRVGKV